jgi:aminoglycoside/choline kinase family phosphotransferase
MESKDLHPNLLNLYSAYAGALPERVETIMGSGSNRQYVRFFSTDGTSLIGVHGTSYEENHAFITLARHFFEKGLPVPQVLAVSDDEMCYLQNDLGSRSLFDALREAREAGGKYGG